MTIGCFRIHLFLSYVAILAGLRSFVIFLRLNFSAEIETEIFYLGFNFTLKFTRITSKARTKKLFSFKKRILLKNSSRKEEMESLGESSLHFNKKTNSSKKHYRGNIAVVK